MAPSGQTGASIRPPGKAEGGSGRDAANFRLLILAVAVSNLGLAFL